MTLAERLARVDHRPSGFDYLRLVLAISVIAFHTIWVCYGDEGERAFWSGPFRPVFCAIVPAFFALSGFLVAGSLERNPLAAFLTLRAVRIFPALAVEVLISALLIGPLLTTLPAIDYFSDPRFYQYFLNVIGDIHVQLPGVFEDLPAANTVNIQLWTVPIELECYILISALAVVGLVKRPRLLLAALLAAAMAVIGKEWALGVFPVQNSRPTNNLLIFSFLFGISLYMLRRRVPFSWPLFGLALCASWACFMQVETTYLAPLPIAYVTVFLGLLNPTRTAVVAGADYSYGMYLYGFPVQQALLYMFPACRIWYINLPASLLVSVIFAYLSWTLLESRIHQQRFVAVHFIQSAIGRLSQVGRRGLAVKVLDPRR
jgi:peptidoglycan/LPS O-acetylase OafA/YrhL